jgi:hypothetical protein
MKLIETELPSRSIKSNLVMLSSCHNLVGFRMPVGVD